MGVRVLGVTLTTAQEILYWFLLPALIRAALFITEIALAVGVAQHHFAQGDLRWGFATVAVLYAPSVTYFVATVSQPGAWERDSQRATATWFCARVAQLLLFPAWAVYRYGKRLFWSVDALAARGQLREDALDKASQPSLIELYLFAHAFLHSAPQAALQLGVTLVQCRLALPVNHVQILCVLTSLGVLAMTLASYQRFESQRLAGRREPWRQKPATLDLGKTTTLQGQGKPATMQGQGKTATMQGQGKPATMQGQGKTETPHDLEMPATLQGQSNTATPHLVVIHVEVGGSKSPFSPTSLPAAEQLLPPEERAPSPPLPSRRRTETALEDDDPLGRSVAAVGWFLFLVSRYGAVLSLASFRAGVVAAVLGVHVTVNGVLLILHLQRRSVVKVIQRCCLALVFMLCPLEYGVRFKRARFVFAAFFVVACAEDVAMTLGWFLGDVDDASFWHGYLVAVIFTARTLSLLCLGIYLALLRPKVTTFYVDLD